MKKDIIILAKNESAAYSSATILFGDEKFKIVAKNGNSYSHLEVYIYTKNGDLGLVASEGDISGYNKVDYMWNDGTRIFRNAKNIVAAEDYITKVYSY